MLGGLPCPPPGTECLLLAIILSTMLCCMCVCVCVCVCVCACVRACMPAQLWPHGLQPSSSSIHGIFKATILEHFAIFFSNGNSWPKDRTHVSLCWQADSLPLSHLRSKVSCCLHGKSLQWCPIFVTLWTIACQAPLSIGFPRQEYWSGLLSSAV